MSETALKLAQAQAAASAASIYTPSGAFKAVVRHIRVVNMDTIAGWIQLWDGGTADTNLIVPRTNLAAALGANQGGGILEIDCFIVVANGVNINAQAHAGSKVTVTLYGAEGVA